MTASNARLHVRTAQVAGVVLGAVLSLLGLGAPAQANKIGPAFFGMHDRRISGGVLTDLPIGSARLWDSGTSWRQLETRKGRFDFTTLDAAVNTARSTGVRPLVVLGQTPRFHATRPNAPGAYGRGATSMPRMAPWKRYVAKVARHYGTSVDYQVWNEPNVVNYWTGSVSQMARLTATASRVITTVAGRKATVVAPSFPLRLDGQQAWYRDYWHDMVGGRSVARYVDVVSANLYPLATQAPEASMDLLRFARGALPKFARGKPVWNTEINYGLLGGDRAKPIHPRKQAAYVARTLALNAGNRVGRVYWYAWNVGPIANTHLAQDDGTTPSRAGRAWGVAEGWLRGTRPNGCHQASTGPQRGVYTCAYRKGQREVHRIYWKPRGRAVLISTPRSTRSWSTLAGDTTDRRGRFRIRVGQVPVMVMSRR